jgi:hypothetical protein
MFGVAFKKCRPGWLRNTTGHRLELDGYSEELRIAFEYHGEQHYDPARTIGKGDKSKRFAGQIERDALKARLCQEAGVRLIVVPAFSDDRNASGCTDQIEHAILWAGLKIPKGWRRPKELASMWRDLDLLLGQDRVAGLRQIAARRGGQILSEGLPRPSDPLRWRCAKGHEWPATALAIERGGWCKECWCNERRDAMGTLDQMRAVAQAYGGECLSDTYEGRRVPLLWRCGAGHKWTRRPRYIIAGKWCPTCHLDAHNEAQRQVAAARRLAAE